MSDKQDTAPANETGGGARSERADDGPSTGSSSSIQTERIGLFDRLAAMFSRRNGNTLREDLEDALSESPSEGEEFSPAERAMLNNILRLREVRVEDVMIPRADIEAVEVDTTIGELLAHLEKSGHSRMPVYKESLDDPKGMIHIRDVLAHITHSAIARRGRSKKAPIDPAKLDLSAVDLNKPIGELNMIRPLLYVPPSMLASDLMQRMQATRMQMALVIDEYGGTDGLVSLEDIIEVVVGDIEDEYDDDAPMVVAQEDGSFLVDGKADIEDVAKVIGDDFGPGEHGDYVDTIGGMIFNALGRVPTRREIVQPIPGFEFHILEADPRRVRRVRIVPVARNEADDSASAANETGAI